MIYTDDIVAFDDEGTTKFDSPAIFVIPRYSTLSTEVSVELSIQNQTTHIQVATFSFSYTYAQINAQTITATTTVEIWLEAIQLLVKDTLETLNPSATFTIA